MEKAREFQKNIYFCFIDYAKAFDCVGHNKLWKFFKEMGTLDHLTCLLRGSCVQHRKPQLEPDMEQRTGSRLGREYIKAVYCDPAYSNFYTEYIMQNARLDEAQAGIKIAWRNINNFRYPDDTALMSESKEELKAS